MAEKKYEMVLCVVNEGFSEAAMDAARVAGARGGTVFSAHGTANKDAEKLFNVDIASNKDVVLMVVEEAVKDAVLKSVYEKVGMHTDGKGIAFSIPVDKAAGIK